MCSGGTPWPWWGRPGGSSRGNGLFQELTAVVGGRKLTSGGFCSIGGMGTAQPGAERRWGRHRPGERGRAACNRPRPPSAAKPDGVLSAAVWHRRRTVRTRVGREPFQQHTLFAEMGRRPDWLCCWSSASSCSRTRHPQSVVPGPEARASPGGLVRDAGPWVHPSSAESETLGPSTVSNSD